ncbi:MAG: ATP-binding protein [Thermoanaerobaculia bacterium]
MNAKRKHSIRGKLTAIIMLTATCALLLASIGYVIGELSARRSRQASDLTILADVIGYNASASLLFGDRESANEVLQSLRAKPSITAACIYTKEGKVFAVYGGLKAADIPAAKSERVVFGSRKTEVFHRIRLDGEVVGVIYLVGDRREETAQLIRHGQIGIVILPASLLIAFVLGSRLQRRISGPIVELARVASLVSQHKNFSVRASQHGSNDSDEIGNLMTGFNSMLAEIEQRDDELLVHQTHLEETVALRTGELTAANEGLLVAKNAAEKIAEINARLARESALILNSATEGILGIGLDNRPTFLNPAGARILGMTLNDLEGKTIHEAVHHSYADGTPWPEADCANTQAIRRSESVPIAVDTFWRRDGTSFPVEYSSTPMFDENGNQLGAVMMFRDVTERRAVERLKSEFVSTVSHELRTPLTSIRGALGLLSSGLLGPVGEKGQRMLEIAVSNTDRLVRLINDILDLERIDSGKVEVVRGPVDANAVMVQTLEGVQSMADQAGVRLVIVPATGALWGDSDRIIQTLTNLVGNAIKFSPPDTTVTLSGAARQADFVFCVADQGRGVPEKKLETIFERFSQVDSSDSRDKGGSGLGLAICHSIVTAHGGRIWVERNDPAGSRFQFTIPLAIPSTGARPAIESSASRTIFVCQDDGSSNIVGILERRGFRVVTATSSADVIARAASVKPDAILLDVADGGNGRQIVEVLESTAETRDIPIVVATGQFTKSYESHAAAVANWVRKPLKSDDLIHALDLACAAPSILVVEDDLDLARVMTTALQSHGIRTFHAVKGSEAVQLCMQHEPSLIVLDLGLPDMDGFAVVSSLREHASLRRIPLLVYSALDVGSADQSRLRLGPTEFLTKSRCSLADFDGHVVRLLETVTNRTKEGRHAA